MSDLATKSRQKETLQLTVIQTDLGRDQVEAPPAIFRYIHGNLSQNVPARRKQELSTIRYPYKLVAWFCIHW